jgi:hypothetical protein
MSVLVDMISRGWDNFLARPTGSMNFRFIVQPTVASVIALRAGVKDAREGRSPFLWGAFTNSEYRWQLLHHGWREIRVPFLVAVTLDIIYQIIVHEFIYPLELLFTATLLALVPYFILRGPVNRIAQMFLSRGPGAATERETLADRMGTRTCNKTAHLRKE